MYFEGMVKVSKEDIGKFLEVWEHYVEVYKSAVDRLTDDESMFYNNLPWWSKLFYIEGNWDDFHKKSGYKDGKYKDYYQILTEMGYLPKNKIWRVIELEYYVTNQIRALSEVGDVVYLNPEQAHLMTKVLKMEEL